MEAIESNLKKQNLLNDDNDPRLPSTLICFSHLRWNFVYQRPQHLLTRYATLFNVYFVEEPYFDAKADPYLTFTVQEDSLWVVAPHLKPGNSNEENDKQLKKMLDKFLDGKDLSDMIFWYYTPMALSFSRQYTPALTIYDCMDELSMFKNAPKQLRELEDLLLSRADIVFTGGHSLYQAKKHLHDNIFPFPSSIDKKHFEQARTNKEQPTDQESIGGPRLGFYGVIDERFDIDLIKGIAELRPEWQLVLLGPVVKIDPSTLPKLPNIHFLGGKTYDQLPSYLSGWDIALIPFMLNDATRFISPTKTPEYLAAGIPVISTPIKDVVNPYGEQNYVEIAADAQGFVDAAERQLSADREEWLTRVDEFLTQQSWSLTFENMMQELTRTLQTKSFTS
ncbi:glycosyltransferase family 1 protein [Segetibacter sp. 3557_3]|uniref:glycosyltransferase family 1 protein n=1 Tax=Segetibacter sp. 3557_3 TaxID=2547429 RepID=UPI001058F6FC|nr:glycosyltransferase family 1 protein [Segetibacter sp. 3557_3]TDH28866.1 glycosyltransferase family 1 protein [Segetibacter sp. 3557_3]